jgi:2-phosphosulfolactate phosphatase
VRVHVALTPDEAGRAPTGIVIDVIRATSTICQALAAGYERVLCAAEVEEAFALRDELGGVLGGERGNVLVPGFDLGNSPREYVEPRGETLILTTTNGTRAILSAAAAGAETVLVGSLLNLEAVAVAAAGGGDVEVVCAGLQGRFTIDDAYCAGRMVELLGGERSDAAEAAFRLARSFGSPVDGLSASENPEHARLGEDIAFCARESVLDVVPRLARMEGSAAEIVS